MQIEIATKADLQNLEKSLLDAVKNINQPFTAQFYNDEECWKAKGGCSLSTYRTNRFYQIKGGIPDGYVGGRKVWSRESLMEWVNLKDDELPAYHEKYKTGAKRR